MNEETLFEDYLDDIERLEYYYNDCPLVYLYYNFEEMIESKEFIITDMETQLEEIYEKTISYVKEHKEIMIRYRIESWLEDAFDISTFDIDEFKPLGVERYNLDELLIKDFEYQYEISEFIDKDVMALANEIQNSNEFQFLEEFKLDEKQSNTLRVYEFNGKLIGLQPWVSEDYFSCIKLLEDDILKKMFDNIFKKYLLDIQHNNSFSEDFNVILADLKSAFVSIDMIKDIGNSKLIYDYIIQQFTK